MKDVNLKSIEENLINVGGYIDNKSKKDICDIIRYNLNDKYQVLYDWLDDVDYDFEMVKKDHEFEGKKMIFHFNSWLTSIRDLRSEVSAVIEKIREELHTEKNIENILPYAYEFLFENKKVHSSMTILEHFQNDNFVFVKIAFDVKKFIKKRNGYTRSNVNVIEREIIIEKWFKNGEAQYKTKAKSFIDQFKNHKKAVTAPKVKEIIIENVFNVKKHIYDMDMIATIKSKEDPVYKELYFYIEAEIQIRLDGILVERVLRPIVSYNDNKYVMIDFIQDTFSNGYPERIIKGRKCYQINGYGGLEEVEKLPAAVRLDINDADILHALPYDKIPKDIDELYIPISEDETKILDNLDFTYHEVTLIHATNEAAEYIIGLKNPIQSKMSTSMTKPFFFAKYGDAWIATDERNRKIRELREASKFADDLIKGWEPQLVEGG